uniref:Uncharacterized protein n=1 Tax=Anguilla anguilla TaxID=7936 RepID=A0A0E9VQY9_ANGAN
MIPSHLLQIFLPFSSFSVPQNPMAST